jgi:hypothetical protein
MAACRVFSSTLRKPLIAEGISPQTVIKADRRGFNIESSCGDYPTGA